MTLLKDVKSKESIDNHNQSNQNDFTKELEMCKFRDAVIDDYKDSIRRKIDKVLEVKRNRDIDELDEKEKGWNADKQFGYMDCLKRITNIIY